MAIFTKTAQNVFASTNIDGTKRQISASEVQTWGMTVESLLGTVGLPTFATAAAAEASVDPLLDTATILVLFGNVTEGDGGFLFYRVVDTDPTTDGSFKLDNGRFADPLFTNFVMPVHFGGIKDDSSTETCAINNVAVETAINHELPCHFDGLYYISDTITQTQPNKIVLGLKGEQSGIVTTSATGNILYLDGSVTFLENCKWMDFTIRSTVTRTSGWAIQGTGIGRSRFTSLRIDDIDTLAANRKMLSGIQIFGALGDVAFEKCGVYCRSDPTGALGAVGFSVYSDVSPAGNASEIVLRDISIKGSTVGISIGGGASVKIYGGDVSEAWRSLTSAKSPVNDYPNRELFVWNLTLDRPYHVNFFPEKDSIVVLQWIGGWANSAKVHNLLINEKQTGKWTFTDVIFDGTATSHSIVCAVGSGCYIKFADCDIGGAARADLQTDYGVGAWVTATSYVIGDYVTQGGEVYYCTTAHTSGVFATDLGRGYWTAQGRNAITFSSGHIEIRNCNARDSARYGIHCTNASYAETYIVEGNRAWGNGGTNYVNANSANEGSTKVFLTNGNNRAR